MKEKCHQNLIKKIGKKSSNIFLRQEALIPTPPPGAPPPNAFGLNPLQPTDYRVSLVSVSESGSQKSLSTNFIRILSTKSTIFPKLNIVKFGKLFFIGFRTLLIFWDEKIEYKIDNISKIGNINIGLRTLRNFFKQKPNLANFQEGEMRGGLQVCMQLWVGLRTNSYEPPPALKNKGSYTIRIHET